MIWQVDQGNSSQHVLVNATQQMVVQREGLSSTIPQLDGPMPDPYDDMLSTPNVSLLLCIWNVCFCASQMWIAWRGVMLFSLGEYFIFLWSWSICWHVPFIWLHFSSDTRFLLVLRLTTQFLWCVSIMFLLLRAYVLVYRWICHYWR